MSKLKRVLSVLLVVALVAAASVAGTVTYLTDRDSQTNVFSVGDVSIRLNGALEEGIALIPGVALETNINIENIGKNAAWVWMTYAVPAALDASEAKAVQVYTHGAYRNGGYTVEEYYTAAGLTEPVAEDATWLVDEEISEVEINGKTYNVYTHLYKGILTVDENTNPGISQIYMDGRVDVDPDGEMYWVENGVATDLNWNVNTDGNPVIYVSAYAIQTEGFDTVEAAYKAYGQQWGENGYEWADPGVQQPDDGNDDDNDNVSLYELMTSGNALVYNAKGENTFKPAASTTVGVGGGTITFGSVLTQESLDAIGVANSTMTADQLRKLVLDYYKLQLSFLYTPTEDVKSYPAATGSTELNQEYFQTYVDPDYVFDRNTGKAFYTGNIYAGIPYLNGGNGNLYRWMEYYNEETGEMDLLRALEENGGYDNGEWMDPNVSKYQYYWYEDTVDPASNEYDPAKAGWLCNNSGVPMEPKYSAKDDCWFVELTEIPAKNKDARLNTDTGIFNEMSLKTVTGVGTDTSKKYTVVKQCDDGKWRFEFLTVTYKSLLKFANACSGAAGMAYDRVVNSAEPSTTNRYNPHNGLIPVGLFDYEYEYNGKTYKLENIAAFDNNSNSDYGPKATNPLKAGTDEIARYWITENETPEQQKAQGIGQSMYECYALAQPADALVSNGHVMIVTGGEVVRRADGSIDPEKSYLTVYEQIAVFGFYGSIRDGDSSAEYMVHGGYVSDFDDAEYDEYQLRNGNYGERYYSFKNLLFKTRKPTSVENITNPYLPFTFAEFHEGVDNEWSKAYIDYYKNRVPAGVTTHRINTPEAQKIVTDAGYTLTKDGEKAFNGIGIEDAVVLHNGPEGAIAYDQLSSLIFVPNYYHSDMHVVVTNANGEEIYTYSLRTNHYQLTRVITEAIAAGFEPYANGENTITFKFQLFNGEMKDAYSAKLLP